MALALNRVKGLQPWFPDAVYTNIQGDLPLRRGRDDFGHVEIVSTPRIECRPKRTVVSHCLRAEEAAGAEERDDWVRALAAKQE